MPDEEILFSILQFVALVAPAMAILMQLLENSDEAESPAFRFLEIGMLTIIFGGSIILVQILLQLENIATQFGVILIFTSLIALAGGIAWRAIPATDDISLSVSSLNDLYHLSKQIVGRLFALIIPLIPAVAFFVYFEQFSTVYLQAGYLREIEIVDIHATITVVALFISLRFILYLINVGYLTRYSIGAMFYESVISVIAGYSVVIAFLSIPFLIIHVLINIPVGINLDNPIFSIAYLWVALILIVIYSIDMLAENEDFSRIAADDEDEIEETE